MNLQHPEAWYYTSRSGRIAKKSKQNVKLQTIYRTFKNIAKSYGSDRYIAVVRRGTRSTVVADDGLEDFRSLLKGADSISSFIPPRIRNISGRPEVHKSAKFWNVTAEIFACHVLIRANRYSNAWRAISFAC